MTRLWKGYWTLYFRGHWVSQRKESCMHFQVGQEILPKHQLVIKPLILVIHALLWRKMMLFLTHLDASATPAGGPVTALWMWTIRWTRYFNSQTSDCVPLVDRCSCMYVLSYVAVVEPFFNDGTPCSSGSIRTLSHNSLHCFQWTFFFEGTL